MINFWSKLNIGITLFSRKWWKLVDIFGQYIIQVSFFEFMSNICCFDLFPFNLFTPKTKHVMLWLKRIKDQIVEKKYFEQEFHQILTIFFQIKYFRRLQFFFFLKQRLCKWHWWKFNWMWWMWSKNQIENILIIFWIHVKFSNLLIFSPVTVLVIF